MTAAVVIKYAIELVAVLLLALGIKGLSKVRSARAANQLAAVAMALAVLGVLINFLSTSGIDSSAWLWIIVGTLVGGLLGAITSQKVPMTAMPETVALFNGCGGMSSLLVALGVALVPAAGSDGEGSGALVKPFRLWCRCSWVRSPSAARWWPWASCRAGSIPRLGCRASCAMSSTSAWQRSLWWLRSP